jgi:hypothetical protein
MNRRAKFFISYICLFCLLPAVVCSYAFSKPKVKVGADTPFQELENSKTLAEANNIRHALHEMSKLLVAAALGILVALVHKRTMKPRPINASLVQAEVLLCVSGALMIVVIGNSLARAFGLAGAAGFIRFRTPMKDPKDTTVLFLVIGLGMACGLGLYVISVLGALFLVIFLWLLHMGGSKEEGKRSLVLEVTASGFEKPRALVQHVLTKNGIKHEVRKITKGESSTFRYEVQLDSTLSIEELNAQMLDSGPGEIKSISWDAVK